MTRRSFLIFPNVNLIYRTPHCLSTTSAHLLWSDIMLDTTFSFSPAWKPSWLLQLWILSVQKNKYSGNNLFDKWTSLTGYTKFLANIFNSNPEKGKNSDFAKLYKRKPFCDSLIYFSCADIKPPASQTQAKPSTTEHNPAYQFKKVNWLINRDYEAL